MSQYFPCQKADHAQIIRLESEAFGVDHEACQHWLQRGDGQGWRGIKNSQGLLQGALVRIPMAQWFCGRAVPMTGVAGVAVATEARAQGVGKKLMTGFLQELHEENVPLSTLYASTTGFYRGLGYERAGGKYDLTVMLRDLSYGSGSGGATLREIDSDKERLAVEKLYKSHVNWHGSLIRDPYMWDRVRQLLARAAPKSPVRWSIFFRGQIQSVPTRLVIPVSIAIVLRKWAFEQLVLAASIALIEPE